jgi:hypothetical protein
MSPMERPSSLSVRKAIDARVALSSAETEFDIPACLRISWSMPAFSMPQMRI